MLQLHLSDRQFYCLLRCILYQRFYGKCCITAFTFCKVRVCRCLFRALISEKKVMLNPCSWTRIFKQGKLKFIKKSILSNPRLRSSLFSPVLSAGNQMNIVFVPWFNRAHSVANRFHIGICSKNMPILKLRPGILTNTWRVILQWHMSNMASQIPCNSLFVQWLVRANHKKKKKKAAHYWPFLWGI